MIQFYGTWPFQWRQLSVEIKQFWKTLRVNSSRTLFFPRVGAPVSVRIPLGLPISYFFFFIADFMPRRWYALSRGKLSISLSTSPSLILNSSRCLHYLASHSTRNFGSRFKQVSLILCKHLSASLRLSFGYNNLIRKRCLYSHLGGFASKTLLLLSFTYLFIAGCRQQSFFKVSHTGTMPLLLVRKP